MKFPKNERLVLFSGSSSSSVLFAKHSLNTSIIYSRPLTAIHLMMFDQYFLTFLKLLIEYGMMALSINYNYMVFLVHSLPLFKIFSQIANRELF